MQIRSLQSYLVENVSSRFKESKPLFSPENKKKHEISNDDLERFGLLESENNAHLLNPANVNELREVGMIDPFPVEIKKPKKPARNTLVKIKAKPKEKNAADEFKKYIENMDEDLKNVKPVYALALPNKMLMFKLMRACIGVDVPQDLWCYKFRVK